MALLYQQKERVSNFMVSVLFSRIGEISIHQNVSEDSKILGWKNFCLFCFNLAALGLSCGIIVAVPELSTGCEWA